MLNRIIVSGIFEYTHSFTSSDMTYLSRHLFFFFLSNVYCITNVHTLHNNANVELIFFFCARNMTIFFNCKNHFHASIDVQNAYICCIENITLFFFFQEADMKSHLKHIMSANMK
jgi:alanine dehydrogenase